MFTGIVQATGRIVAVAPQGDNLRVRIDAGTLDLADVRAGDSIAVDGVSLTTNAVDGARFTVHLIPHTLAATTLGALAPGAAVNIEVDVVARYVERLQSDAF